MDLHIEDVRDVGKPLRRSKGYSLKLLKARLGRLPFHEMTRPRIVEFGRDSHASERNLQHQLE